MCLSRAATDILTNKTPFLSIYTWTHTRRDTATGKGLNSAGSLQNKSDIHKVFVKIGGNKREEVTYLAADGFKFRTAEAEPPPSLCVFPRVKTWEEKLLLLWLWIVLLLSQPISLSYPTPSPLFHPPLRLLLSFLTCSLHHLLPLLHQKKT